MVLSSTEGKPVPLNKIELTGKVHSFQVEISLKQTWYSESDLKECKFSFPLNHQIAITSFSLELPDLVYRAEIRERSKGEEIFEKAKKEGQTAAILTEHKESGSEFCLRISNLPKQTPIQTHLTFVQKLEHVSNTTCKLYLPMTIAPKYPGLQPSSSVSGLKCGQQKEKKFSSCQSHSYPLDLKIQFKNTNQVTCSSLHPVACKRIGKENDREWEVSLSSSHLKKNCEGWTNDLVLLVDSAAYTEATLHLEEKFDTKTKSSSVAGMLSFGPGICSFSSPLPLPLEKEKEKQKEKEILFMVDCSGSMDGSPIQSVKEALHLLISSLPLGYRFNIMKWGDKTEWFRPSSVLFSQETEKDIQAAHTYVTKISAEMGGTEMYNALSQAIQSILAFQSLKSEELEHELIFLTDGELEGSRERILNLVASNCTSKTRTRLWSIGFGPQVQRDLLETIAITGGGWDFYVNQDNQEIKMCLLRILDTLTFPVLRDVQICLNLETPIAVTPFLPKSEKHKARHRTLVSDRMITFFFLVSNVSKKDLKLDSALAEIKCLTGDEKEHKIQITSPCWLASGSEILHKLHAKSQINDLERGQSELHLGEKWVSSQEIQQACVGWSLREQILSKHTCFVVVSDKCHQKKIDFLCIDPWEEPKVKPRLVDDLPEKIVDYGKASGPEDADEDKEEAGDEDDEVEEEEDGESDTSIFFQAIATKEKASSSSGIIADRREADRASRTASGGGGSSAFRGRGRGSSGSSGFKEILRGNKEICETQEDLKMGTKMKGKPSWVSRAVAKLKAKEKEKEKENSEENEDGGKPKRTSKFVFHPSQIQKIKKLLDQTKVKSKTPTSRKEEVFVTESEVETESVSDESVDGSDSEEIEDGKQELDTQDLKSLLLLQSPNGSFRVPFLKTKLEEKVSNIIARENVLKPDAKKLFLKSHKLGPGKDWWTFLCCLYLQKYGKEEHKFILEKVQKYLQKQKIEISNFIQ